MKKFILFARLCTSLIFVFPFTVAGQLVDHYPNYVVIGAFAHHKNAVNFTDDANKNKFPALFEMNPNRNLYYVYVLSTDDRELAIAEAVKLRADTKYFDTWVYCGALGKMVLANAGGQQDQDVDPLTGKVIEHVGSEVKRDAPGEEPGIDQRAALEAGLGEGPAEEQFSVERTAPNDAANRRTARKTARQKTKEDAQRGEERNNSQGDTQPLALNGEQPFNSESGQRSTQRTNEPPVSDSGKNSSLIEGQALNSGSDKRSMQEGYQPLPSASKQNSTIDGKQPLNSGADPHSTQKGQQPLVSGAGQNPVLNGKQSMNSGSDQRLTQEEDQPLAVGSGQDPTLKGKQPSNSGSDQRPTQKGDQALVSASEKDSAGEKQSNSKTQQPSLQDERELSLAPPPTRATTEPLKAEDVVEKDFYFHIFRADNGKTVGGEVDAIDFERARLMATYEGNKPVTVRMPSGKTKQVSFLCQVFGYRKQQQEFDPTSPAEDLYLDDKGNVVVPFELVRLQKGDIAIMYNVFFYKDAAVMRPESRYEVNNLLELLNENPSYKIIIHGHTNGNASGKIIRMDTPGNFYSLTGTKQGFGSAKKLSEERAIVIREFLINSGIQADRMQVEAWGGKKPIHDKHSARAHENVRVEIEILSK